MIPGTDSPPHRVTSLQTQDPNRSDDLFITCNSFEERCLGVPRNFHPSYRTRFSCIFRYEPNVLESPRFEQDRKIHFSRLHEKLSNHTLEHTIPIFCNRQSVEDGIGQFRQLFSDFLAKHDCSRITIDITCFTKLYLFELLHFLTEEVRLTRLRATYNQARAYGKGHLTVGTSRIFHMPHFAGRFLPNRGTVLIAFLGFETERALGIWEHYEPFKTIVILSDPPRRKGYLERAEASNSFLLSRPAVIRRTMNPYDPFEVATKLEELYVEQCTDHGRDIYNVGVISLSTKVQSLGLFLFWKKHKNIRITYAFPKRYGEAYAHRSVGDNFVFDLRCDV